jgi:hypothetical protein
MLMLFKEQVSKYKGEVVNRQGKTNEDLGR